MVESRDGHSMADHPVVNVSWYGAVAFCNWLSEDQGLTPCYDLDSWERTTPVPNGYRLPTEAEWERAAAWDAGSSKHWVYGFQSDNISKNRCNYEDSGYANPLNLTSYPYTTPIGYYDGSSGTTDSPSEVGCYDLSGNVCEWCHDRYSSSYYDGGAQTDPPGPSSGTYRVLRGGSWRYLARYCRSAFRHWRVPDFGYYDLGLRLVVVSPGTP